MDRSAAFASSVVPSTPIVLPSINPCLAKTCSIHVRCNRVSPDQSIAAFATPSNDPVSSPLRHTLKSSSGSANRRIAKRFHARSRAHDLTIGPAEALHALRLLVRRISFSSQTNELHLAALSVISPSSTSKHYSYHERGVAKYPRADMYLIVATCEGDDHFISVLLT